MIIHLLLQDTYRLYQHKLYIDMNNRTSGDCEPLLDFPPVNRHNNTFNKDIHSLQVLSDENSQDYIIELDSMRDFIIPVFVYR